MDTNDIVIEQVKEFSEETAEAVRSLLKQLVSNYKPLTDDALKEMLNSPQSFLLVAKEATSGQIAGMITLTVFRIPDSKKAYLDDVIVDEKFRGRGIAVLLTEKAIALVKENNADYVELTSNPKRVAAIHIYEKLGFQKRDTNVYRLRFSYEKE